MGNLLVGCGGRDGVEDPPRLAKAMWRTSGLAVSMQRTLCWQRWRSRPMGWWQQSGGPLDWQHRWGGPSSPDTSTIVPHLANWSSPTTHGSWMLTSQNKLWTTLPATFTCRAWLPSTPVVSAHLFRTAFMEWTSEMAARQEVPSRLQSTYKPYVRPSWPSHTAEVLGFVESALGNGVWCGPAPHSSITCLWTVPPLSGLFRGRCGTVVVACPVGSSPLLSSRCV